jgi:hypothetical protein
MEIPQTTHPKTAQSFGRSSAGVMTRTEPRAEDYVLHSPSHVLPEPIEGTEATNYSEEEKYTLVGEAYPGDGSAEARYKQSSQGVDDETKALGTLYTIVHSFSDDPSMESSRDISSEEYEVTRSSSDENGLAVATHLEKPPQEGSSSPCSSRTPPRMPKQDASIAKHPSDRDSSNLVVQRLLHHDAGTNSEEPARWRRPHRVFRTLTVPSMISVLLCLFAPSGVGAAPITVHHNSSQDAATLLPSLTTEEGLVLISSVAWLLRVARSLTRGRDQRDIVPLCIMLIAVLPLSMFVFGDVNLESR